MQVIKVTNDARQKFTTVLNSQKVQFEIFYLQDDLGVANPGWFCNLTLLSGTSEIVTLGERMQVLVKIGKNLVTNFSGGVFVVPTSVPFLDLTSTSPWSNTHRLVYLTQDEIDYVSAL